MCGREIAIEIRMNEEKQYQKHPDEQTQTERQRETQADRGADKANN